MNQRRGAHERLRRFRETGGSQETWQTRGLWRTPYGLGPVRNDEERASMDRYMRGEPDPLPTLVRWYRWLLIRITVDP